jgi:hypothetical protein
MNEKKISQLENSSNNFFMFTIIRRDNRSSSQIRIQIFSNAFRFVTLIPVSLTLLKMQCSETIVSLSLNFKGKEGRMKFSATLFAFALTSEIFPTAGTTKEHVKQVLLFFKEFLQKNGGAFK